MANETYISEDRAKKAMVDAARLADELRGEQDIAQAYEKEQKLLECQIKDIQQRLDDLMMLILMPLKEERKQ